MGVFDQKELVLPKPKYEYITDEESARKALNILNSYPDVAIDTEATDLDPYEAKLSLIQMGVSNHVFVFDVRHDTEHSNLHKDVLAEYLKDASRQKILQNAVFDMKLIKHNMGFYLENIYDTMLAEQLLNLGMPGVKASLEALVLRYLGLNLDKEPRGTFEKYDQKFKPYQLEYAANDVVPLHTIRDLQWSKIQKENLENAARLEFEFTIPMSEMELNGITLDTEKWSTIMSDVKIELEDAKTAIQTILDRQEDQTTLFDVSIVNIDSSAQLLKALRKYGLNLENTAVGSLERHKGIPVIDAILDYRKAQKLISSYSNSLIEKINPHTGRLHTQFKQMVSTGRMSSSNPNLQQIPKKQKFRSCFIAKPDYVLLTSDMSGAELRILGNLSQDPIFIESYAKGMDLHTRTAAEVFGVPLDKVTHKMRGAAKAINFGLCASEDSIIFTSAGQKYIKDVMIEDETAHDIGTGKIIDKAYMGEKEVFEIETKYGYSLEVTADHPVKVIDKKGIYRDKKLIDLNTEEDLICLKKESNLFSDREFVFDKFEVERRTSYKDFDLPEILNEEWSAFLGLFISEGSVFKAKKTREKYGVVSFGFSKENKEFIKSIDYLFNKLFDDRASINDDKYKRYTINSVLFAEWLFDILDLNGKDKTKEIRIPMCIKESPKKHQIAFLKRLFEGDGSVKKNGNGSKITYSSNSKNLLKDIQLMLLNFGILSSITEESRSDFGGYYLLSILACSNEKFISDIGFITHLKNDKYFSNVIYNTSSYFLGNHKNRIEKILKENNLSEQIRDRFYKSRHGDSVGNIYLKELSLYDKFFKFIYENNIVPLSIKSIKSKGIKRVYDLSVDNHQYFLANGFIIHNCYGMSVIGLSKRLKIGEKEAKDMINKYFDRYRGVKKYLDRAGRESVRNRFSTTVSGRKRYYNMPPYDHPDHRKIKGAIERKGKNAGIQGSNADTIKEAMILLVKRLEPYDARLILTVHDEVVVEAHKDQRYEVAKVVSESLCDGFGRYFSLIPMRSDTLIGPCWLKDSCENKPNGTDECGHTEMMFKEDKKYKTKLVCGKCGGGQE